MATESRVPLEELLRLINRTPKLVTNTQLDELERVANERRLKATKWLVEAERERRKQVARFSHLWRS